MKEIGEIIMECNLENCTGIGIIEWESEILAQFPKEKRILYIENNAERLREQYCREVCPVTKFRRRYERKNYE
jgi:hypothetical protein